MKKSGVYNRYIFLKKMNKRSLVLIKGKKRYVSFGRDLEILKYINFNMEYKFSNLAYLNKFNINYVVLDNLDVIKEIKFDNNEYLRYLKLMYLKKILVKIGNN